MATVAKDFEDDWQTLLLDSTARGHKFRKTSRPDLRYARAIARQPLQTPACAQLPGVPRTKREGLRRNREWVDERHQCTCADCGRLLR
jgi:hypothetical protein